MAAETTVDQLLRALCAATTPLSVSQLFALVDTATDNSHVATTCHFFLQKKFVVRSGAPGSYAYVITEAGRARINGKRSAAAPDIDAGKADRPNRVTTPKPRVATAQTPCAAAPNAMGEATIARLAERVHGLSTPESANTPQAQGESIRDQIIRERKAECAATRAQMDLAPSDIEARLRIAARIVADWPGRIATIPVDLASFVRTTFKQAGWSA